MGDTVLKHTLTASFEILVTSKHTAIYLPVSLWSIHYNECKRRQESKCSSVVKQKHWGHYTSMIQTFISDYVRMHPDSKRLAGALWIQSSRKDVAEKWWVLTSPENLIWFHTYLRMQSNLPINNKRKREGNECRLHFASLCNPNNPWADNSLRLILFMVSLAA